jgi:hypothetical protein
MKKKPRVNRIMLEISPQIAEAIREYTAYAYPDVTVSRTAVAQLLLRETLSTRGITFHHDGSVIVDEPTVQKFLLSARNLR